MTDSHNQLKKDWSTLAELAARLSVTASNELEELPSLLPTICRLLQVEVARCRETGNFEAAGIARAVEAIAESLEKF
ncbi:hypothetical protein DOP62_14360 (plasmid) [Synechococcus elongatus PCC 11801]|uniref:Uncharacterized protein n=1 Tax=Synechococcus elongatus PCC 11801 TaxID=2219813 RepID=A0ACD5A373_SYNEL